MKNIQILREDGSKSNGNIKNHFPLPDEIECADEVNYGINPVRTLSVERQIKLVRVGSKLNRNHVIFFFKFDPWFDHIISEDTAFQ